MKNIQENLKILECLYDNPCLTQRELVCKLGISLGKINFLLNELVKSGFIKLTRFKNSKNRAGYLYIVTPKGLANKSRIVRVFFERKMQEYEKIRLELSVLSAQVSQDESADKPQLEGAIAI